jgi:hypothetical protein
MQIQNKVVISILNLNKGISNSQEIYKIFTKAKSVGFPVYSAYKLLQTQFLLKHQSTVHLSYEGWICSQDEFKSLPDENKDREKTVPQRELSLNQVNNGSDSNAPESKNVSIKNKKRDEIINILTITAKIVSIIAFIFFLIFIYTLVKTPSKSPIKSKKESNIEPIPAVEENTIKSNTLGHTRIERIRTLDISEGSREIRTMIFKGYGIFADRDYPVMVFQNLSNGYEERYPIFSNENDLNMTSGMPLFIIDSSTSGYKANPEYLNRTFTVESINDSILITWADGEVYKTTERYVTSLKLDTTEYKVMTMIFTEYSEGDLRHMIFKDSATGTLHDFRFYSDELNRLSGIPILLDAASSYGHRANPEYLNKTFIIEVKIDSVMDWEDFGIWKNRIKKKVWIITSLRLNY